MAQCEICGTELVQGRGPARRTCSAACRQKAHRRKQAAEVERLRGLATREVPAPVPERVSRDEPKALGEDRIAGLPEPLRALWVNLAEAVAQVAGRVESGWDCAEIVTGMPRPTPEDAAFLIRHRADKLAAAVLAAAGSSRNEPERPAVDDPASTAPPVGPSRDKPAAVRPGPLSAKKAKELAAGATLVSTDKESHSYDVVAVDGTVLGHVAPAYKAGRRSGWQGWAAGLFRPSEAHQHRHSTRDQAGADALGQWLRLATAGPRR